MADRSGQCLLLTDEDLMFLSGGGDVRAFAALYDHHTQAAYSLAYRLMGERQAVEDLVRQAFLEVWQMVESYRVDLTEAGRGKGLWLEQTHL